MKDITVCPSILSEVTRPLDSFRGDVAAVEIYTVPVNVFMNNLFHQIKANKQDDDEHPPQTKS